MKQIKWKEESERERERERETHLFWGLQGLHEGLHQGGQDFVVEVEQHTQRVAVNVLLTGPGGRIVFMCQDKV